MRSWQNVECWCIVRPSIHLCSAATQSIHVKIRFRPQPRIVRSSGTSLQMLLKSTFDDFEQLNSVLLLPHLLLLLCCCLVPCSLVFTCARTHTNTHRTPTGLKSSTTRRCARPMLPTFHSRPGWQGTTTSTGPGGLGRWAAYVIHRIFIVPYMLSNLTMYPYMDSFVDELGWRCVRSIVFGQGFACCAGPVRPSSVPKQTCGNARAMSLPSPMNR